MLTAPSLDKHFYLQPHVEDLSVKQLVLSLPMICSTQWRCHPMPNPLPRRLSHHPTNITSEPVFRGQVKGEHDLGFYNSIDEPARTWLLDLFRTYNVELLFAGHTHFAMYNRVGATRLFTVPSTTTSRPGFARYSPFYHPLTARTTMPSWVSISCGYMKKRHGFISCEQTVIQNRKKSVKTSADWSHARAATCRTHLCALICAYPSLRPRME